MRARGVVNPNYVQRKREIIEEFRADINGLLLNRLKTREKDDRDHFSKMRSATEARLKSS